MSNEQAKIIHSKRLQQKKNYVKKQTKIAKAFGLPVEPGQEHRLQDHAVMNCGNPGCIMCANPRKVWKEKTKQEKSFEQHDLWNE